MLFKSPMERVGVFGILEGSLGRDRYMDTYIVIYGMG